MRAQAPHQSLDYWLEEAQGVIILPGVYQAGFFYSIQGGEGLLVARMANGLWSAPVFMSVGGAGFGIQAGLEKSRMVLVITGREALDEILAHGLHFAVTAKYTMLTIQEVTGPDSLHRNKPVVAVSDGVGIMAGVALKGGILTRNDSLSAEYYGISAQHTASLLKESRAPGLEVWELWDALTVTLPKERIQQPN
jgi:lipid-binding SYLF domain-containing protein